MLNGRYILAILCCLAAAPVGAQTLSDTRRTFVDVIVGPDWDDLYRESARAPGATWRTGLALGLDWGRSGVEIDVSVPQWHVNGSSFGWAQQGHSYETSSSVRRRSIDVIALYRTNLPINRHITFTWLAGGGYVYRPEEFTSVTREVLPGGQRTEVNAQNHTSSHNYLAAAARVDLEFRLAPHLSLVPRLRLMALPAIVPDDSSSAPRLLLVRPEVGVRWQF